MTVFYNKFEAVCNCCNCNMKAMTQSWQQSDSFFYYLERKNFRHNAICVALTHFQPPLKDETCNQSLESFFRHEILKEIVEDFFQTCKYLIYPIIFVINYKETLLLSVCICERNFPTRTDVYCILSPDSIQNKYRSVHPSQCLLRFQYFARVVVGSKNILQHFPLKGRTYACKAD